MPLLTAREVAELLRVSVRTVRRWRAQGRLHGFRLAGDGPVRYPRSSVDRLLGKSTPHDTRRASLEVEDLRLLQETA